MSNGLGRILRTLGHSAGAVAPATPTLAVADPGTGTSITATITGEAGATHRLFYKTRAATAWTTGLTRVGNGTISQTGLTGNTQYEFIAVSDNGLYSLPSSPRCIYLAGTDTAIVELIRLDIAAELGDLVTAGIAAEVIAPARYGEDPTFDNKDLVLVQGDPIVIEPTAESYQTFDQPFGVICAVRLAESSTAAVDASINDLVARVQKKLCEDRTRTGLAIDTYIDAPEALPPNRKGVDGAIINLRVRYRVREDNPFSQT